MYFDDLTLGADSEKQVIQQSINVKSVLDEAKLPLVKWIGSTSLISKSLQDRDFHMREELDTDVPSTKLLGLVWNPNSGMITFGSLELCSLLASIYDPLGLLSPAVLELKLLMQRTWIDAIKWDDMLDEEFHHIAPVKILTLPKLELTAALLRARLCHYVEENLPFGFKIGTKRYFSDSQVALAWICSQKNVWKPYVTNRVHEICNLTTSDQWYYLSTSDNPADLLTRMDKVSELLSGTFWTEGPSNLEEIPFQSLKISDPSEERKSEVNLVAEIIDVNSEVEISRFSINAVREDGRVSRSSKIIKFRPFLDPNGFLRLGGDFALLSLEEKHPIFLHPSSKLTEHIILDSHLKTKHGEVGEVLYHLRRPYWILKRKRIIRSVLNKCLVCRRFKLEAEDPVFARRQEISKGLRASPHLYDNQSSTSRSYFFSIRRTLFSCFLTFWSTSRISNSLEIVSIINSRPLVYISESDTYKFGLTPEYFLSANMSKTLLPRPAEKIRAKDLK
uniref:Uncharacterized protein n=1 Tax=Strigamia maritima TaxID=126957 RepID=T1IZL0_STRMM